MILQLVVGDNPSNPTEPDYKCEFNKIGEQIDNSNKETQNTIKDQTTAINNQQKR